MAFVPVALAGLGTALGASSSSALAVGSLAAGSIAATGATLGSTIAGAVSGGPKAPAPIPGPPQAASIGQSSIASQGAQERQALASAAGAGLNGTDETGGQGASAPPTTKSLLG